MPGRKPEVTLRTAGGINYEAARRRVKNLNIRVRLDGTVAVSIPLGCSWADADRLVLERLEWIEPRCTVSPCPKKRRRWPISPG